MNIVKNTKTIKSKIFLIVFFKVMFCLILLRR